MKSDDLARAPRAAYEDLAGRPRIAAIGAARFGRMGVVCSDRGAGRLYGCPCGERVWSSWGHAEHHAQHCAGADVAGAVAEVRAEHGAPAVELEGRP